MKDIEQYDSITLPAPKAASKTSYIPSFDVAVIGGGLAGLSVSIQLAKEGFSVVVFEKERYPFHRVCGEYISLESWNFLENLGYPLSDLDLPIIKNLIVSAPNGDFVKHSLPLGGFGISRYKIDYELAALARANGVTIHEGKKVTGVDFENDIAFVKVNGQTVKAKVVCGAFGKRSNLDITWNRSFAGHKPNKLNNYIGVKYHIQIDSPSDTISLHNFQNGYCGLSKIEENKFCLCYLTTALNLKASDNSIINLEKNILQRNPFLRKVFHESKLLYQTPLTISQVSFERKLQVENHVLMIGDASGMITPLCGNGMSMALHASKIAAELIRKFLSGEITRHQLENEYTLHWSRVFSQRLTTGRLIQKFFGREWLTNTFIHTIKPFPKFISYLIRQTHGQPF